MSPRAHASRSCFPAVALGLACAFATLQLGQAAAAPSGPYHTSASRRDEAGILNVHLIPHTHDDVGWLKTPDQYFYGGNNSIQHACVDDILDSTIASLLRNPNRKFIYVEQAFFQRWWVMQPPALQDSVRQLVAMGQLEFVNGGWTMHDEACPSFVEMMDQMTLGHRHILTQFGPAAAVRTAWSIDPFGHSAANVALFASPLAGMSSFFISRADFQDVAARIENKSLEWLHTPSDSLGPVATSWTSIMNAGGLYFPQSGLSWDLASNDEPFQDNANLEGYNVDLVVAHAINVSRKLAESYVGDVYLTQGFDFAYQAAEKWFKNMDKLIHYVNLGTDKHGVNMFYSTPNKYASTKIAFPYTWPSQGQDDQFPYATSSGGYFTGFTTSRSALKAYIRDSSARFTAARQLQVWAAPSTPLPPSTAPGGAAGVLNPLTRLDEALGIVTHHDAVTGTSKQHVAFDYALRLSGGRADAEAFMGAAIANLTGAGALLPPGSPGFVFCELANATICPSTEQLSSPVLLAVYNSQGRAINHTMRYPVAFAPWRVTELTAGGASISSQMDNATAQDTALRGYYGQPATGAMGWLSWVAPLPPAGVAVFLLQPSAAAAASSEGTRAEAADPRTHPSNLAPPGQGGPGSPPLGRAMRGRPEAAAAPPSEPSPAANNLTISNGLITLTFDAASGLLQHFENRALGISTPLTQEWWWYNASAGNNKRDRQASGAYVFRPNSSTLFPVNSKGSAPAVATQCSFGPVVTAVCQVFSPWLSQTVRLWEGEAFVDIEWTVGPIPHDDLGREVITRFTAPGIQNQGAWASDSNGRDMMRRRRNFRPSWNATIEEPVAGNYAPVSAAIEMADTTGSDPLTFSVVVDRSQGGGSVLDGTLELLVQRRLAHDDNWGVGEPLNETGVDGNGLVVRGLHRLNLLPASLAAAARRDAMQQVSLARPMAMVAPLAAGAAAPPPLTLFSGLGVPLPPNVALVSLQAYGPLNATTDTVLLRLAHSFALGEGPMANNATVDLATLLSSATVLAANELTITANQPLYAVPANLFRGEAGTVASPPLEWQHARPLRRVADDGAAGQGSMVITLSPLQIRTFLLLTERRVGPSEGQQQQDSSLHSAADERGGAELHADVAWLRYLAGEV